MVDPYNDSDLAYKETPLESSTPIPTVRTCPRRPQHGQGGGYGHYGNSDYAQQFQQLRYPPLHQQHSSYDSKTPGYGPPPHQQQHFDLRGGGGYGHSHQQQSYQRRGPHQYPGQSAAPMLPPEQFLDQHLEIFQAPSYTIPDDAFKIDVGGPEEINYAQFCTKEIYDSLIKQKSRLSSIDKDVFAMARKRCNPYEMVGNSIFMNRAAVKLASMDSQLALTANKEPARPWQKSPHASSSTPYSRPDVFRFVDLCSGPGGFSEYLLWRKHTWGERAHGWATTLKGDLDFTLEKFVPEANAQHSLTSHYGADGTGNLLKRANLEAFAESVDRDTAGLGVGLVAADGGVNMDADQAAQELHMRHLILNQILTMFLTLQKGGDFVIKMFDIFTPVTAELVWILSRHFEKICVLKPLTSRPMNSERYVVCRHLLERRPARTIDHLFRAHQAFEDMTANVTDSDKHGQQVRHILAPHTVSGDDSFMAYLRHHNLVTAKRQLEALNVCLRFANDRVEPAFDQRAIMRLCLQEWRIPPPLPSSSSSSSSSTVMQSGSLHGGPPASRHYGGGSGGYRASNQGHPNQPYSHHQQQHHYQQQQQQRPRPPNQGQRGHHHQSPGFQPYNQPNQPSRPQPPGNGGGPGAGPGSGSTGGTQTPGLLDSILNSMQKPTSRR